MLLWYGGRGDPRWKELHPSSPPGPGPGRDPLRLSPPLPSEALPQHALPPTTIHALLCYSTILYHRNASELPDVSVSRGGSSSRGHRRRVLRYNLCSSSGSPSSTSSSFLLLVFLVFLFPFVCTGRISCSVICQLGTWYFLVLRLF